VGPSRDFALSRRAAETSGNSHLVLQAVKRVQEGDSEGLHFLYVRYVADMRRYLASIVHDQHEAEDIAQDVFAKLISRIGKYQPQEAPFGAWLMRVARNAALDHMRARRVIPIEEVRVTEPGGGEIDRGRTSDLRRAFEELPDDQREVLILRHVVGLSPVEIANTLKKTESSVHGLHHRGRRTLRAKLVEMGAAPVVRGAPG
jgi:RNA polymerase sigma-70 factor (ECF subfamily)